MPSQRRQLLKKRRKHKLGDKKIMSKECILVLFSKAGGNRSEN